MLHSCRFQRFCYGLKAQHTLTQNLWNKGFNGQCNMIVENFNFTQLENRVPDQEKELVLCAFNRVSHPTDIYSKLQKKFPQANIVTFTTSGHFISPTIEDAEPVISAVHFEKSNVVAESFDRTNYDSSYGTGKVIGESLEPNAKGLLVISDGGLLNGTDLIAGINEGIEAEIPIFGGLAGDNTRFEKTLVGLNEEPTRGKVIAISFYGESLDISANHDSAWTSLGLEFKVTKSNRNELYELNNRNAYEVLYDFLGSSSEQDFNKDTLYYPFRLDSEEETGVIRTPILVDHENKVLTYAGNMPEGSKVQIMKSGTMELLDATLKVAEQTQNEKNKPQLVLAISCVGRRVVLDDMADEEFTELHSVYGDAPKYFGFYSYGEFSRTGFSDNCKLHNQTLTLATLSEN